MSIQTKSYKSKKTRKKTTKFYAVVYAPATDHVKWSSGFATRAEAKAEELRMMDLVKEPELFSATFGEVAKSWLLSSDGVYANSTLEGYKWYLKKYVNPVFENDTIDSISPIRLQNFVNRFSMKYSAETTNKVISILSNVFNHAASLKIIPDNTAACIKRRKVAIKDTTTWSEAQIKAFLCYEKVIEHRCYEMFLLAFCTEMRPSEICGVNVDDLRGDLLILNRSYDRYEKLSNMKGSNSHRSIRLPSEIAEKLNVIGEGREHDFLFVNSEGKPINPNSLSQTFKRLLKSFNKNCDVTLPDVSLYDAARHSFGTNMIVNNEVPVSIVSSIMGNSERVLQSRYVHVKNEVKSIAISSYAEMII